MDFRRLVDWQHLRTGVFIASLLESTVVPIPLEVLLVPAMVARRDKLWSLAGAALLGCLLGAAAWYMLGAWFFDSWGMDLVAWLGGSPEQVASYQEKVEAEGFWIVLAGGLTPTPFQVVCLVAGAVTYSIPLFAAACAISRGIRYYGLAALVYSLGERAERVWKENKLLVATTSFALLGLLYAVSHGLQQLMDA